MRQYALPKQCATNTTVTAVCWRWPKFHRLINQPRRIECPAIIAVAPPVLKHPATPVLPSTGLFQVNSNRRTACPNSGQADSRVDLVTEWLQSQIGLSWDKSFNVVAAYKYHASADTVLRLRWLLGGVVWGKIVAIHSHSSWDGDHSISHAAIRIRQALAKILEGGSRGIFR